MIQILNDILAITWNFLKKSIVWILSDWKNLVMISALVAATILYFRYSSVSERYDNVIREHADTVMIYKNKIGELYAMNSAYITDIRNLEESNRELYDEVKNLKDNPIVVTKYRTVTEYKEIFVSDTAAQVSDSVYSTRINYTDPYTVITGTSTINTSSLVGETSFETISFTNNFTLDLVESRKGDLSFIVKSDNPHCRINSLNGVMLSPEDSKAIRKRYDKPWCLVVGVGPSLTMTDNRIKVLPSIQVTVGRKIISF